jgi:formylglycine-generating enzyme required for sulfatase activity
LTGGRPLSDRQLVEFAYGPRQVDLGEASAAAPCAALLARCLALRPEHRPTAAALARELEALLHDRLIDETRSPFRGLAAFTEADAQDFHGREAETDAVIERLRTEGLVPIVGPSGVGKSSFINAGLVPRLRELGPHLVVTVRPGRRPLASVVAALSQVGSTGVRDVLATVATAPGALVRALRMLAAERRARVLLVIDQFEEVLTLGDPGEASALLEALSVTALPDEACRVLLSFRSDFLGQFAATRLDACLAALTVVRPLSKPAIERAIIAPLERMSYRVDLPTLPARIADELAASEAALPLLQFAMDALWRRRDAGRRVLLTQEYEAMGGALGALATHAEHVSCELSQLQRAQTRALMLHLVNVDGTRRPRSRAELVSLVGADAGSALDHLIQNRLLSAGSSEETGEAMVELAHESLTATWPALARWLAETHEARRFSHELEQAAALWEARGRKPAETWLGDALRDAQRRSQQWGLALTEPQQQFLAAGQARHVALVTRARHQRVALIAALAAIALTMTGTTLLFRQKEQQAIAQQQEIRTAAADMGRFELRVEAFDWDAVRLAPVSVDASTLPLELRFHAFDRQHPLEPGPLVNAQQVVRSQPTYEQGVRSELVELKSAPTWVEVRGRGAGCAPSWILAQGLPGYSARAQLKRVTLKVPTCQASWANTVEVPGGPYVAAVAEDGGTTLAELPTFRIDAYETTREVFALYASLGDVTEDHDLSWVAEPQPGLPVSFIDFAKAQRFCRYMGKRVQSRAEWTKVSRGGQWLDAARTVKNPLPARLAVWGNTLDPSRANNARQGHEPRLASVGTFPLDASPYGAFDLSGNLTEWTRDLEATGMCVCGGNWGQLDPEFVAFEAFRIDRCTSKHPQFFDGSLGVRCSSE